MSFPLSTGSCRRLFAHDIAPDQWDSESLVQLLSIKNASQSTHGPSSDRYRVLVSDGENYVQALLDKSLNGLVEEDRIGKHSVVVLVKASSFFIQGKRVIQLLELYPVKRIFSKIGDPTPLPPSSSVATGIAREAEIMLASSSPSSSSRFPSSYAPMSHQIGLDSPARSLSRTPSSPAEASSSRAMRDLTYSHRETTQASTSSTPTRSSTLVPEFSSSGTHTRGSTLVAESSSSPTPMRVDPTALPPSVVSTPSKPAKMTSNTTPSRTQNARPDVTPIASLNSYTSSRNCIKAIVSHKDPITPWKNGKGTLFKGIFLDDTAEINFIVFDNVKARYDQMEEGGTYIITNFQLKPVDQRWRKQHDYEIQMKTGTKIELCEDELVLPPPSYNFVPLNQLKDKAKDSRVDVIGILQEIGELIEPSQSGQSSKNHRRVLTLVDQSTACLELVIWGTEAQGFDYRERGVIAIRQGKMVGSRGVAAGMWKDRISILEYNPDLTETYDLQHWYRAVGPTLSLPSQSDNHRDAEFSDVPLTVQEVRDLDTPESDGGKHTFTVNATVVHVFSNGGIVYPACPACKKKVEAHNNAWRCKKCNKSLTQPNYRYMFSFEVADCTGRVCLQAFEEVGNKMFKQTANQYMESIENAVNDNIPLPHGVLGATYKFTCVAKEETYKEQTRTRYTVNQITPVKYVFESERLVNMLRSPWSN